MCVDLDASGGYLICRVVQAMLTTTVQRP